MRTAAVLALALAASCAAAPLAQPATKRPKAASKALVLRGGDAKTVVLALNAVVTLGYGVGCTFAPTQVMKIYGSKGAINFMDAGHALSQYLGGMQAVFGLRCVSALAGVGFAGFPACNAQDVLVEMCTVHTGAALIAAYRFGRVWRQSSLLAASASPLPGSLLYAGLSYWAARKCADATLSSSK